MLAGDLMTENNEKNTCTHSVQQGQKPLSEQERKGLVYARLRILAMEARGIALRIEGGAIMVTGSDRLTDADHEALKGQRAAIFRILELGDCQQCHKLLDPDGCCWACCNRRCGCGGWTGSAFISMCHACAVAEERRAPA